MRDLDVRTAVRRRLEAEHGADPNTRIVEEMGIWSGSARVDIAVINGELCGIELKSARDTLERLDRQAELYNQVFDRVILVAAERHIEKVYSRIPGWWGVTTAVEERTGSITLQDLRPARRNRQLNALQLARLLWRTELLAILQRRGFDKGVRSKPAEVLARRAAEVFPTPLLALEVREALKSRPDWLR